jgi:uncharacterized membrane protein (UPF0127 family)
VAGSSPKDPYLAASRVPGFDDATIHVVDPAGRALAARCALLAATDAQHERGLMGRRDLAGYAAMAFVFRADVGVRFYNRNVPIALSVAFFDAAGRWVGSADMEPCADQAGCPEVGIPTPYRTAIEVPKGQLASIGLAQGSQLTVTPGCG